MSKSEETYEKTNWNALSSTEIKTVLMPYASFRSTRRIKKTSKTLMAHLLFMHHAIGLEKDDYLFASIRTLRGLMGCGQATLENAIIELENHGLITFKKGEKRSAGNIGNASSFQLKFDNLTHFENVPENVPEQVRKNTKTDNEPNVPENIKIGYAKTSMNTGLDTCFSHDLSGTQYNIIQDNINIIQDNISNMKKDNIEKLLKEKIDKIVTEYFNNLLKEKIENYIQDNLENIVTEYFEKKKSITNVIQKEEKVNEEYTEEREGTAKANQPKVAIPPAEDNPSVPSASAVKANASEEKDIEGREDNNTHACCITPAQGEIPPELESLFEEKLGGRGCRVPYKALRSEYPGRVLAIAKYIEENHQGEDVRRYKHALNDWFESVKTSSLQLDYIKTQLDPSKNSDMDDAASNIAIIVDESIKEQFRLERERLREERRKRAELASMASSLSMEVLA